MCCERRYLTRCFCMGLHICFCIYASGAGRGTGLFLTASVIVYPGIGCAPGLAVLMHTFGELWKGIWTPPSQIPSALGSAIPSCLGGSGV